MSPQRAGDELSDSDPSTGWVSLTKFCQILVVLELPVLRKNLSLACILGFI